MQTQQKEAYQHNLYPDERGRFGAFGGKFVPESLMTALAELENAYEQAINDTGFQTEPLTTYCFILTLSASDVSITRGQTW